MTSKKKNHKKLTSELEIVDERSDNPQEVRSVNISIILEYIYIYKSPDPSFIHSLTHVFSRYQSGVLGKSLSISANSLLVALCPSLTIAVERCLRRL